MSVRLNWGAANVALAESIKIYRSDTTFTTTALPEPIATLAGSATSYDDTTVVRNKTYYYRVGQVRGGEELISDLLIQGHYPDTGPGPQKILRGDWELGFFGEIPAAQVFTVSGFMSAVGGNPAGTQTADATMTAWYKFIRRGKILLIPNYRMTGGALNWIQLYKSGVVYGSGTGDTPNIAGFQGYLGPVDQNKVVSVGAYQFKVRLPTLSDQPTSEYVTDPAKIAASEWVELMGRMGATNLPTSPQNKWSDVTPAPAQHGCCSVNFSGLNLNMLPDANSYFDTIGIQNMTVAAVSSRYTAWVPVLELIL